MFEIFTKLGGENAALDVIASATGERPNPEAVRKWKRDRRIPGLKAVHLLDECTRRGLIATWVNDCVMTQDAEAAE